MMKRMIESFRKKSDFDDDDDDDDYVGLEVAAGFGVVVDVVVLLAVGLVLGWGGLCLYYY